MNTSRFISAAALVAALAVGWQGESAGAEQSRQTTPVPILMYHVIADPPAGAPYPQLYVSESEFAAQMRWLGRHGYHAVTQRAMWDHWHRGRAPACATDRHLLRRRLSRGCGQRAADHAGTRVAGCPEPHREEPPRQWRLEPMACPEAHRRRLGARVAHADPPGSAESLRRRSHGEVAGSRAILRSRFGAPVDFFCYPAGRYDARVVDAVRRAGYLGATTTLEGLARPTSGTTATQSG
jgi:peptidoglycan/xylan/chitin deacetylase (PgdA/CDA1 family)